MPQDALHKRSWRPQLTFKKQLSKSTNISDKPKPEGTLLRSK